MQLRVPAGTVARPTAVRAREALFASLGPLDGMCVADLFAGTGALGLEAASRGGVLGSVCGFGPEFVQCDPGKLCKSGSDFRCVPAGTSVGRAAELCETSCPPCAARSDCCGPALCGIGGTVEQTAERFRFHRMERKGASDLGSGGGAGRTPAAAIDMETGNDPQFRGSEISLSSSDPVISGKENGGVEEGVFSPTLPYREKIAK